MQSSSRPRPPSIELVLKATFHDSSGVPCSPECLKSMEWNPKPMLI